MKIVKRMADIERLQEKGEQSNAYIKFLEEYFLQLWKVGVFHDNGSMQIFFSQIGELDEETEAWMVEYHNSSKLFSGGFQRQTTTATDPEYED